MQDQHVNIHYSTTTQDGTVWTRPVDNNNTSSNNTSNTTSNTTTSSISISSNTHMKIHSNLRNQDDTHNNNNNKKQYNNKVYVFDNTKQTTLYRADGTKQALHTPPQQLP